MLLKKKELGAPGSSAMYAAAANTSAYSSPRFSVLFVFFLSSLFFDITGGSNEFAEAKCENCERCLLCQRSYNAKSSTKREDRYFVQLC